MYSSKAKYREFTKHLPQGSLAIGKWMATLPGFSDALKKEFKQLLLDSEKSLLAAIESSNQEALHFEFDMSVGDAYRALSETCYLLAEYRVNVTGYKYAPYEAEATEEWEEQKH